MTVSTKNPVNTYRGNSSVKKFDFDFLIEDENELIVKHFDKDGILTVLKSGVDYRINEIGNNNGSYIEFPLKDSEKGVLGTNETISLGLNLAIKQESEFRNSSYFNFNILEWTFDYIVRILQMLDERLNRCVLVDESKEYTPNNIYDKLNSTMNCVKKYSQHIDSLKSQMEEYYNLSLENKNYTNEKILEFSTLYGEFLNTLSDNDLLNMAKVDLSNLDNVGKQYFLNKNQVTNCILEYKNRIKLEYNNLGEIILKKGSILVYPDSETLTFKEIVTDRDYVADGSFGNTVECTELLCINGDESTWAFNNLSSRNYFCSTTIPVINNQYAVWFNPSTFEMKYTDDYGTNWVVSKYTFPLFSFKFVNNPAQSREITHVYNISSFFGSYVLLYDGTKLLMPNGRNNNGTLNNIEVTTMFSGIDLDLSNTLKKFIFCKYQEGATPCVYWGDEEIDSGNNKFNDNYTLGYIGEIKFYNDCIDYIKESEAFSVMNYFKFPYILESYRNGSSWYRIWSDGWIEQGGVANISNAGANTNVKVQVNLLTPFSTTDYTAIGGMGASGGNAWSPVWATDKTQNTVSFASFVIGNTTLYLRDWYACGY